MAPQSGTPVASTVLGTIGTILWCVQLVPQIWTNWRTKKTDGLPALMMFLWAICGVPFGTYSVIQNFSIPIQIQPQMFMALCLVSWTQVLHYGHGWPAWKAATAWLVTACTFAGVETALILTLRPVYDRGNEAPALVVGILASVLLAAGLLPPYIEIWKRRGRVVGINFVFLSMDCGGAIFSLLALVAQNSFDVLGGVLYIVCACLEIGLFISHIVWRIRTRTIRKQAKAEGKTFDDVMAEHRADGTPFAFSEREIDPRLSPSAVIRRMLGRDPKKSRDEEEACTELESGVEVRTEECTVANEKAPSDGELAGESSHQHA